MNSEALSAQEFDRIAERHCKRWSKRSLDAVRSLIVDGKRLIDVAVAYKMTSQQANVLRQRFLDRVQKDAQIKVPAVEFMQSVSPASEQPLDAFRNEIRQLVKHGYSCEQIHDYLSQNDIQVDRDELTIFLEALR